MPGSTQITSFVTAALTAAARVVWVHDAAQTVRSGPGVGQAPHAASAMEIPSHATTTRIDRLPGVRHFTRTRTDATRFRWLGRPMSTSPLTWRDLDDTPDDGNRYEVIDGVLYVSGYPTY